MTNEKLQRAIGLSGKIAELEQKIEDCKKHSCEWIEFTFGNGSSRANVCNDKDTIQLVRNLIIKENESKLEDFKRQFSEL